MFILTVKPCQREIATGEIGERQSYRERSKIKERVLVHWRARCYAKGPRSEVLSTLRDSNPIEPMSPDWLRLALSWPSTTKQLFHWKIRFMNRHISCILPEPIFGVMIFIFGLLVSWFSFSDTVEYLTANLKSINSIGCYIDWNWNLFSPYILLNAHRAGHWPHQKSEKMRTLKQGNILKT